MALCTCTGLTNSNSTAGCVSKSAGPTCLAGTYHSLMLLLLVSVLRQTTSHSQACSKTNKSNVMIYRPFLLLFSGYFSRHCCQHPLIISSFCQFDYLIIGVSFIHSSIRPHFSGRPGPGPFWPPGSHGTSIQLPKLKTRYSTRSKG